MVFLLRPSPRVTGRSSRATTARKQWAYKGKPVYLWSKDTKPGDTTGDNFNNVWHVVKE